MRTLILTSFFLIQCAIASFSQKTKEIEITQYACHGSQYNSDKLNYRGSGYAESSDLTIARDKALIVAKEALANSIKSQINAVTTIYINSSSSNSSTEFKQEFEGINIESVDETLEGVIIICQKQEKLKGNKNKFYIACEIGTMLVINKIEEKIQLNKKLNANFNKEAFENIFNTELEKLEKP